MMKRVKLRDFAVLICLLVFPALAVQAVSPYSPLASERRRALVQEAGKGEESLPRLGMALYDEDAVVRLTAARLLRRMGEPAEDYLRAALENSAADVRRVALLGLEELNALAPGILEDFLRDPSEMIQMEAARILVRMEPRTEEIEDILRRIVYESTPDVRAEVIGVAGDFRLPMAGWKFKLDPEGDGRSGEWYLPSYDDSGWDSIDIGRAWQEFGYDYIGKAWYRGRFSMPDDFDCDLVEIHFRGVDECGWVWINGEFAGEHDMGPGGWNIPFKLDVTDLVKWGEENQIAVKVMNTRAAGGIWQPITIDFLKIRGS